MTGQIMGQLVLMFFLMGMGVLASKLKIIQGTTSSDLSNLLLIVIGPALIIRSLQQPLNATVLHNLSLVALGMGLVYLIQIGISHLLFRQVADVDQRRSAIFGSIYSNCGFIGLPLASAVFGEQGVFYAVVAIAFYNIFAWTHGVTLFQTSRQTVAEKLVTIIKNPNIIAMLVGLTLFFSSWRLPEIVNQGLAYLGSANTPLSMLIIGHSLAQMKFGRELLAWPILAAIFLRNLVYPLVSLAVFAGLGLSGVDYLAPLLMMATPVGSMAVLFTLQAKGKPDYAVMAMGVSTLLCVGTIPLIFVLSNWLTGI